MTDHQTAGKTIELEITDFRSLDATQLMQMKLAGEDILECYRVLKKGGMNIVGEILRGQGTFYKLNHYPEGDVFDPESHSQYYYHSHRGQAEHGHFHTFLRSAGMTKNAKPVDYAGDASWPEGDDALSHLVAISMDKMGFPISFFTVNRWVTAESWYKAEDVIDMLPRFKIDHAYLSWPVNRWITAMICLFRPQIDALVMHRDLMIDGWREQYPDVDVFEDRRLEVTGEIEICVEDQLVEVVHALNNS